jgi:hypothetical protein
MLRFIYSSFKVILGIFFFINLIYSQVYAQSDFKVGMKYGIFLPGSVFEQKYQSNNTFNVSVIKQINKASDIAISVSYIPLKDKFFDDDDYEKYMLNVSAEYKFNYNLEWIERLNLFARGGGVWNHSKENEYKYSVIGYPDGKRISFNRFGINIGVGSNYLLTKFLSLELTAEHNQLFTKEDTMSFGIIHGGLTYIF